MPNAGETKTAHVCFQNGKGDIIVAATEANHITVTYAGTGKLLYDKVLRCINTRLFSMSHVERPPVHDTCVHHASCR